MTLQTIRKYFATLQHIRLNQLFWLCVRRLYSPKTPLLAKIPARRQVHGTWITPPALTPSLSETHLTLLHQSQPLSALGTPWHVSEHSDLWNYHLHYFEDLLGQGALARRGLHQQMIARWIAENPPATGKGWDPYPLSRRLSYWIMAEQESPGLLNAQAIESLALQAEHLSHTLEYHLQGNHLLANAKALTMAGLFFRGDIAEKWHHKGEKLLVCEVKKQFLADGAHEEGSPMYHALMVMDLLDVVNFSTRCGVETPEALIEILPKALDTLRHLTHPDGDLALFNDSALNIAPKTADIHAYASALGIYPARTPHHNILRLESGEWVVLFDAGEIGAHHQPGHAHADHLTFEASFRGQRLIVDTGTSEYGNTPRRMLERSTAAHNTLVVDNTNSSHVWSNFRLAERARPFTTPSLTTNTKGMVCAVGSHNGYAPILHRRQLTLTANGLEIEDFLEGSGTHDVQIFVHFAPGIRIEGNSITTQDDGHLQLTMPTAFVTVPYEYAPEFGRRVPASLVVARAEVSLPLRWVTRITC